MTELWLRQFEQYTSALRSLGVAVHGRLEALLKQARVPVSFITWRLKEPRSLAHKLSRPPQGHFRTSVPKVRWCSVAQSSRRFVFFGGEARG